MRVLYPDEVFIVNALADYVLLILTARVTGGGAKRRRIVLAAALGGAYSVIAALYGGFFASPVPALALAVLMALTVFGGKGALPAGCSASSASLLPSAARSRLSVAGSAAGI